MVRKNLRASTAKATKEARLQEAGEWWWGYTKCNCQMPLLFLKRSPGRKICAQWAVGDLKRSSSWERFLSKMKAYACLMSKGKHQVEEFAAEGGG